jgi:uncharacterized protein (DUF58 family)
MTNLDLEWSASAHRRRLLTVACVAVVAAAVTGHEELLVVAAAPLLIIAAADRGPRPTQLTVRAVTTPERCIEGDVLDLAVHAGTDRVVGQITVAIQPIPALRLLEEPPGSGTSLRCNEFHGTWRLRAAHWGRWTVATASVTVRDRSRLWQATASCPVGELTVYPQPAPLSHLIVPRRLRRQLGTHVARAPGPGVEFAGIRAYVPGDQLRDIHWPSSLRMGRLHIIQHAAEQAADIVVGVDAFSDVGGSLGRSVRGCAGVAQGYLRVGDRVGLVVLGGGLRWLPPDTGQRTLYRITDEVIGLRRDDSVVTPDLSRLPRQALPPAALVMMFTPLLDERAITLIDDLCVRGVSILIIDVLTSEPGLPRRHTAGEELAVRLWRLDRAAQRQRFSEQGVTVVRWDAQRGLDDILTPALHLFQAGARS